MCSCTRRPARADSQCSISCGLGHVLGDQDLRGGDHVLRVELSQKGREDLPFPRSGETVEEEGLLAHQSTSPDEEELHAGVGALPDQTDDVLVDLDRGDHLLAFPHAIESLDPVAQHGRALEVEGGGGAFHLLGEGCRERVVLALQEPLHIGDRAGVPLVGLPPRAGGAATTDVVLDARPLETSVDLDGAGSQGKELTGQTQGFAHGSGRIERTVVGGPVAGHTAGYQEARERLVGGQLEERIVLVVAQDDVVARPVLANEGGLQHQRLELVVGHDVLEVADLPDEGVRLGIARARFLEVRTDPRA